MCTGMMGGSNRRAAELRPLVESRLPVSSPGLDGLRADLNSLSLAFPDLPTGNWSARRWAVCRHLGPQNRAVDRSGLKGRRIRRKGWSSRSFRDAGKSGSGGPLGDHLGLDPLDAAVGVTDGAIAEADFLEAWLDYLIEMGSAHVEDARLAWLVVKVARSVNFAHHVSASVRRRLRPCADHGCFGSATRQRLNKHF